MESNRDRARNSSRRDFLKSAASAGVAFGFASAMPKGFAQGASTKPPASSGKRLLILGGTAFLGPELVAAAKAKNWTITLFNRGKTNPHLFPELEKLHGDRNGDLKSLEGRDWDAVIDTSGYTPKQVTDSAGLLKDHCQQYVFISSISVYAEPQKRDGDESAPVGKLPEGASEEKVTNESYGPLKARCEQEAEKAMPGRALNIRPGLIVGPNDSSDRFTYWPVRVARGGEVLAPGKPEDPVQFIDVRDLAEWTIRTVEAKTNGVFNASGPKETLGIGTLLDTCKKVSGSDARFTWADAKFLEENKVSMWSDMPCWVPGEGETEGSNRVSCVKAVGKGLTYRPLETTVKDTLSWWNEQPEKRRSKLRAGIDAEREKKALDAWHTKKSGG